MQVPTIHNYEMIPKADEKELTSNHTLLFLAQ